MDLVEYIKSHKPKGFAPRPYYSAEGDSLTFFFENVEYYGQRIDDFLTAYRAIDGNGLVGCQIKGLPKALALLGDFKLSVSDGKVLLTMIFIALMAQTPEEDARDCYRELGKLAAQQNASIPAKDIRSLIPA
jgi:hypothetical protein